MGEEKQKSSVSTAGIIISFIFIQPLAVFLLGLKLRERKTAILKSGQTMLKLAITFGILFFVFAFIDYKGINDILFGLYLFGAGSIIGFVMSQIMIRQGLKDDKYKTAIKIQHLTKIKDIASAMQLPEEKVVADLSRMIKDEIFPFAELNMDEKTFELNSYSPKVALKKALKCTACGASVVAVQSKITRCEYCGTPVNFE